MTTPLRVLVVEDRPDDAELLLHALRRGGFDVDWQRVDTEAAYLERLDPALDLILADYALPGWNALRALELIQMRDLDIPLIIVSGTIGEELAVEAMKKGATDYLLKDRLARLGQAVERALEEKRLRDERREVLDALRQSEEKYRRLFDDIPLALFQSTPGGELTDINPAFVEMLGYPDRETLLATNANDIYQDAEERAAWKDALEGAEKLLNYENRFRRYDGKVIWARGSTRVIRDADSQELYYRGSVEDITERRQMEIAEREQRALAEALVDTAATIGGTLELDDVLERILANVERVLPHDAANIILVEPTTGVGHIIHSRGFAELGLEEWLHSRNYTIADMPDLRHMAESGQPVIIPDIHTHRRDEQRPAEMLRIHAYLGAPIRLGEETLGFLNLNSTKPGFFTPAHAEHLQSFAYQAAIAIQNARLYQELGDYSQFLEQAVEERTIELQREKLQVEAILQSAGDAIVTTDLESRMITVNPAFEAQTGYSSGEVVGETLRLLGSEELSPEAAQDMDKAMRKGEFWRGELTIRRKDGTSYEAEVYASPLYEEGSGLGGYVGVMRDVSAQKELVRMKDEFVSNVSHELRTPISSIKLFLGLMQKVPAHDKRDEYFPTLHREAERLNRIIEDLLRLSRLDQDRVKLHSKPVDLNTLAEEYATDRAPLAQEQGLTLTLDKEERLPPIQADAGLLGQVLSVLLTNALNYTPTGGQIIISTQLRQSDDDTLAGFSVSDTGPGIPPDERDQLFERFFRGAVGRESGAPGTGLGLSIAREIVDLHGGQIEVESEGVPGQGTTFTVWLSVKEPLRRRKSGAQRAGGAAKIE